MNIQTYSHLRFTRFSNNSGTEVNRLSARPLESIRRESNSVLNTYSLISFSSFSNDSGTDVNWLPLRKLEHISRESNWILKLTAT